MEPGSMIPADRKFGEQAAGITGPGYNRGPLFLTVEIIQRFAAEEPSLGRTDEPFLAVGIVGRFADRVIGDDKHYQIFGPLVQERMRFLRLKNKRVTAFDR